MVFIFKKFCKKFILPGRGVEPLSKHLQCCALPISYLGLIFIPTRVQIKDLDPNHFCGSGLKFNVGDPSHIYFLQNQIPRILIFKKFYNMGGVPCYAGDNGTRIHITDVQSQCSTI